MSTRAEPIVLKRAADKFNIRMLYGILCKVMLDEADRSGMAYTARNNPCALYGETDNDMSVIFNNRKLMRILCCRRNRLEILLPEGEIIIWPEDCSKETIALVKRIVSQNIDNLKNSKCCGDFVKFYIHGKVMKVPSRDWCSTWHTLVNRDKRPSNKRRRANRYIDRKKAGLNFCTEAINTLRRC